MRFNGHEEVPFFINSQYTWKNSKLLRTKQNRYNDKTHMNSLQHAAAAAARVVVYATQRLWTTSSSLSLFSLSHLLTLCLPSSLSFFLFALSLTHSLSPFLSLSLFHSLYLFSQSSLSLLQTVPYLKLTILPKCPQPYSSRLLDAETKEVSLDVI